MSCATTAAQARCVYYEDESGGLLTKNAARRIAANIAECPVYCVNLPKADGNAPAVKREAEEDRRRLSAQCVKIVYGLRRRIVRRRQKQTRDQKTDSDVISNVHRVIRAEPKVAWLRSANVTQSRDRRLLPAALVRSTLNKLGQVVCSDKSPRIRSCEGIYFVGCTGSREDATALPVRHPTMPCACRQAPTWHVGRKAKPPGSQRWRLCCFATVQPKGSASVASSEAPFRLSPKLGRETKRPIFYESERGTRRVL